MGKSTFARRLADALVAHDGRRVVAMDPTGEWVRTAGVGAATYAGVNDWLTAGICVDEPPAGAASPVAFALRRLEDATKEAKKEFVADPNTVRGRTLLMDEAHIFVPEPAFLPFGNDRNDSVAFAAQLMTVRKYGMSAVFATPRTAVIGKGVLTQCENFVAFRMVDQTGIEFLQSVGGATLPQVLPALKVGEAVLMGPALTCENPVAVKVAQ
jgi:DNA helicase HerA-like ATPase